MKLLRRPLGQSFGVFGRPQSLSLSWTQNVIASSCQEPEILERSIIHPRRCQLGAWQARGSDYMRVLGLRCRRGIITQIGEKPERECCSHEELLRNEEVDDEAPFSHNRALRQRVRTRAARQVVTRTCVLATCNMSRSFAKNSPSLSLEIPLPQPIRCLS